MKTSNSPAARRLHPAVWTCMMSTGSTQLMKIFEDDGIYFYKVHYTNITVDPSDDCTFWLVGNYLKSGAASSTTRIGSFVLRGCK